MQTALAVYGTNGIMLEHICNGTLKARKVDVSILNRVVVVGVIGRRGHFSDWLCQHFFWVLCGYCVSSVIFNQVWQRVELLRCAPLQFVAPVVSLVYRIVPEARLLQRGQRVAAPAFADSDHVGANQPTRKL